MRRIFTLLICSILCLIAFGGNAQALKSASSVKAESMNEGFEIWPATDWTAYIAQQGSGWVQGTAAPYQGKAFATKIDEMEVDSDDWLVSPKFTVTKDSWLEFYEKNKYVELPTFQEHGVYISVGSDKPSDGDFVLIKNMSKVRESWTKVQLNLAAYVGKEVSIGFHYIGNFASVWNLDALRVFEKQKYDVEVMDIIVPNFAELNDEVSPSVKLINLGSDAMLSIQLKMSVNGVEEIKSVSLNPEEVKEVAFSPITVDALKQLEVIAQFGDETLLENNTMSSKIRVYTPAKAFAYCIHSKSNEIPMGPVSFQSNQPENVSALENPCENYVFPFGGTMINNLWFTSISAYVFDDKAKASNNKGTTPMNYSLIDTETGALYQIAPASNAFEEMAYNRVDDQVYALNNLVSGQMLYSIDYKTGETKEIALASSKQSKFFTFAISKDGAAYGVGTDKFLYKINLVDFSSEKIGPTGVIGVSNVQSMEFDLDNDILYWTQYSNTSSSLYAVDTETGRATNLGDLQAKAEMTSLGFISGEEKHFAAFKIQDEHGNLLNGIQVKIGERTAFTDKTGIVAFVDLSQDETHDYEITFGDHEISSGTLAANTNGIVDIELSGLKIYDAAVLGIDAPEYAFVGEKVTVEVRLANKGFTAITDLKVKLVNAAFSDSQVVSIPINGELIVQFDELPISADANIECEIELVNDENSVNNTYSKYIAALIPKEAYAYSIFSEGDVVASGPVKYMLNTPDFLSTMDYPSSNGIYAKSGAVINNYWFVNNVSKTKDQAREKAGLSPKNFALLNMTTGQQLNIAPADKMFMEMAFNYKNDKLYGIIKEDDFQRLYTINYLSGECNLIATAEKGLTTLMTFAIDKNGAAYAIGFDKNLYQINLQDFSCELVGATGVSSVQYSQSMAFDHEHGFLYWNLANNTDGQLYYVNTESGRAGLIGDLQANAELVALGFPYGEEKFYAAIRAIDEDKAPMEDVEVTLNGETILTDDSGVALFMDLESEKTYSYKAKTADLNVNGEFLLEQSKVIDVEMSPVGLHEINLFSVGVYPNPCSGILNIQGLGKAESYALIDIEGHILQSTSVTAESETMDLSNLPAGVYTLVVYFNSKVENHKLVIRKL